MLNDPVLTAQMTWASMYDDEDAGLLRPRPPAPPPLRQALVELPAFYPHVKIAQTYSELRAIGRIRHSWYVAAQGKPYPSAVRDADCLLEIHDFTSVNLYAVDATGPTAAMRVGRWLARTTRMPGTYSTQRAILARTRAGR